MTHDVTSHDKPGTVLVTGATGNQGGSVARELLRRGWPVRALTRDPSSTAARALADAGAEVVQGDLDDPAALDAALAGAYGVYSVQTFMGSDGIPGEERQGRAVADAALKAGVEHFVYGSVGGADRHSGVPHFDSKARIEAYITTLGLPATILRPAFFTSNFAFLGPARAGQDLVLALGLARDTTLQMIDPSDIGLFAADAFDDPTTFIGRQLEVASDELTGPQMAEVFAAVSGTPTHFHPVPIDQLHQLAGEEMALMFAWFIDHGYRADVAALRATHPQLTTLQQWAEHHWSAPTA